jgi:enamine deaminase RidA (YjgF/YER057c/UK114 family)
MGGSPPAAAQERERRHAMTPEEHLSELGISLPTPPQAVGGYVTWVTTGNLILTSGQLPWRDGRLVYVGRLGAELTVEDGYQAARISAINALAQLKQGLGELSRVTRVLRLEGNVHTAPGFHDHSRVLDGASDLFNEVFGERGRHTRTALGIGAMPLNAAIQLIVFAEFSS